MRRVDNSHTHTSHHRGLHCENNPFRQHTTTECHPIEIMKTLQFLFGFFLTRCVVVASIETFQIDLDAPPEERWTEVLIKYQEPYHKIANWILQQIPDDLLPEFEAASKLVESLWPNTDLRKEIEGIAKVANLPAGLVLATNLDYELHAGCTSIVAQNADGTLWHGRNLDYDIPDLQSVTINVQFVRNGQKLYEGTTYVGYIGLVTGVKHGAFSLSMDARDTGGSLWDNLFEWIFKGGKAVPFFYRNVFENTNEYGTALEMLQTTPMIAPSYLIIAGTESGQGAVITRNRDGAEDTWTISDKEWFLVQTNDDHWLPPEDNRRDATNKHMEKYDPTNIDSKSMLNIMNMKPTLNRYTTYTSVMSAGNNYYYAMIQNNVEDFKVSKDSNVSMI